MSTGRRARVVALLSGWATASVVVPVLAEEPTPTAPPAAIAAPDATNQTGRAADLYDEATRLFDTAQYSLAAEKFLEADALVPSSEALSNAIATARRATAPVLVAKAARRAIARELVDPALATRARVALNEVAPELAAVHARCTPEPCELSLNGTALSSEIVDVLPGDYLLSARAYGADPQSAAAATSKRFTASAGAEYEYVLYVPAASQSATPSASEQPAANPHPPAQAAHSTADTRLDASRGLPPWVFWGGVAATGVLTGITTWSGLETLDDKDALPSRRDPNYATATEDVHDSAQRTDWLLTATLVTAASTAAVGIWAVEWGDGNSMHVGAAPVVGGATVRWWGHFR